MEKEEKIVISLSPIEVNKIEGMTHDDRISRLEQFIISKLDNYMAPDEINTLNNETLLEVILDVVNRNFYINMGFSQLKCTYRE